MINNLKKINPEIKIYSVNDPEFARYGKIITGFDSKDLITKALEINKPDNGAAYTASIPELEAADGFCTLQNEYYGGMDIQIGLCWGYNVMLDALEYHKCTEINIAATDMLVFLGKLADIKDGVFSSDDVMAFFVPAGTTIELYNDTLHYCPCQTSADGFYSIVVLMKNTNGPLNFTPIDNRIIGHNKWVIWHKDAAPENGFVGISGTNLKLNF
ncbi:MAG: DUF4867 family protein [Clostridia bacterium]|nr:DUF4867 family protein [Clostridia bacterium]